MELNVKEETVDYGTVWKYEAKDGSFRFAVYKYDGDDDTYYLANVFVDEESRGNGIGNFILDTAENAAKKANAKTLCLEVKTGSFAYDWYKRHGYVDVGKDEDEPSYTWMTKDLNDSAMKKKLYILFPGGFKPAHAGHILLAENAYKTMSEEYDAEIYFIVSAKNRDDVTADSTVRFLSKICENAPYMHVVEPEDCPSPIRYAYVMTQTKMLGDGCYCLLSSTKDSDIKRARDFFRAFDKFGKYHTEGVEPILIESVSIPLEFTSRTDEFQYTPISASVLRMDVANNDFDSFFDGYRLLVEMRWIDKEDLDMYFEDLRSGLCASVEESLALRHLNEGGLGGHISHPYEADDLTFEDLSELVKKLFNGDITDVTEKVDGMNLFASVDLNGEPIFARNQGHIKQMPYRMKDLSNPDLWRGGKTVADAFKRGAEIVSKVFRSMDDPVDFFNIADADGNLLERKWLDVEVIDPENTNVIPYDKVMVMFHMFKKAVECPDGTFLQDYDDVQDLEYMNKVVLKSGDITAKVTPKVIIDKNEQGANDALKFIADLNEIRSDYGLPETATIRDYKYSAMLKYVESRFGDLDADVQDSLAERWSGGKVSLYWFKEKLDFETYTKIRQFEDEQLKQLQKKAIRPLELIFIKVGNSIIAKTKNLVNSGNESKAIAKIKKQITDIIDLTDRQGTEKDKDKLEQLLVKLDQVGNTVNATEGVVLRYNGRLLKLTGSFAIINQMSILKYGR